MPWRFAASDSVGAPGAWYDAVVRSRETDFPDDVARLFWEVDPASINLESHRDYVIERVMTRGTWAAMKWLREAYSTETLADFLRRRGDRLAPRDAAYWSLVCGVHPAPHTRPSWTGR